MKRGPKSGAPPTPTSANAPPASAIAPAVAATDSTIYKATYSGVPVYEFLAKGIACMRRRSDGWLNATQILKVADFDKPQRTRILEREVQRGLHEKVQGGYGKYQGTWVPLERGREIAKLYNVEEILLPIFDFRPSTESPPLAPKHVTAASSKPRPARANAARAAPAPRRALKPTPPAPPSVDSVEEEEEEEEEEESMISDIEPLMSSPAAESSAAPEDEFSDIDDNLHHVYSQHHSQPHQYHSQHSHNSHLTAEEDDDVLETLPYHKEVGGTLGRKRKHMSMHNDDDHHPHHLHPHQQHPGLPHHQNYPPHHNSYPPHHLQHNQHPSLYDQRRRQAYSDELLDYFMSSGGGDLPTFLLHPPPDFNVNEIIDDEAHTAFHWAAAMGDLQVLELLLRAGADIQQVNARGETPLMRAVLFTNNYDRKSFPRLVELLRSTIPHTDKFRSSVFHHIAATTLSRNKCIAARYYADVLLQKMAEIYAMSEIGSQLNGQDQEGDTALTIAARNGAKKLIRSLLAYNTNPHIPNAQGQTADELIVEVEKRKAYSHAHQPPGFHHSSSSPYQPHLHPPGKRQSSPLSGPLMPISTQPINHAPASYAPPLATSAQSQYHPPPPQPHISEAAIRATQKAIPDIAEKLEALARAFDAELEEKEKDLRQAWKLLEDTEREMNVLGGRYRDLEKVCLVGGSGEPGGGIVGIKVEEGKGVEVMTREIEKLRVEEEVLAQELKRQVEIRQVVELGMLVGEMERRVQSASSTFLLGVANGHSGPSTEGDAHAQAHAQAQTQAQPQGQAQTQAPDQKSLEPEQQLQMDAAAAAAATSPNTAVRPPSSSSSPAQGAYTGDNLEEKLAAAKELTRLQSERKELVDKIVDLYARSSSSTSAYPASRGGNTNTISNPSAQQQQQQSAPSQPQSQNGVGVGVAAIPSRISTPPRNHRTPRIPAGTGGAGVSIMSPENKIAGYRRLIAHCVGLEVGGVEDILPDLLNALEGPKEDGMAGAAEVHGPGHGHGHGPGPVAAAAAAVGVVAR